ncbi:MAG TPA: GNAT family N-acetyltransferase [Candidatus Bathyarchaeia archaeon]|jgi:ribosomal protein S18 acetylase RimI-like enzyme|nr:GNAT family N-acetyltransferase [Candidatus Bathyarchaeia archaeon]
MKPDILNRIKVVELQENEALPKLSDSYVTANYYDLSIVHEQEAWKIEFRLKPFEKPLEKNYTGTLFEEHIMEPRAFAAVLDGQQVGWIELGYEKWNNRMRVWELLVKKEFRRKGIGTILMSYAKKLAKEKGARMLVLETQSCIGPAIIFYLEQGFELIGFDAAAYSNEDVERKEIRMEFGIKLQ